MQNAFSGSKYTVPEEIKPKNKRTEPKMDSIKEEHSSNPN
jgi:hypothetical protein